MANLSFKDFFEPNKMKLAIYGRDRNLTRVDRKWRGRVVNGEWSIYHEPNQDRDLLEEIEVESHSFVRNFFNLLVSQGLDIDSLGSSTYGSAQLGIQDIANTTGVSYGSTIDVGDGGATNGDGYRGANGDTNGGLLVGSLSTAFSFENYSLAAAFIEGTATNAFNYQAMVDHATTVLVTHSTAGGTFKWTSTYVRNFNNNDPGTVNRVVWETGLLADLTKPAGRNILVARDVLTATVVITAGNQLRVTYTITTPDMTA